MNKLWLCVGILLHSNFGSADNARPLPLTRRGRNLGDVFPFNTHHHRTHDAHHEQHRLAPVQSRAAQGIVPDRQSRQSNDIKTDLLSSTNSNGERCVQKVMMVEELEYDNSITCHHSYQKRCHTTYSTDYQPQQKEECDENFKKDCYIEYKISAFNETVEICNEKSVRDCNLPGPTVCDTTYESECETRYHEHEVEEDQPDCRTMQIEKCRDVTEGYSSRRECDKWPKQVCSLKKQMVKRYTPQTQCSKKPREICGPGPCPIVPGPEECRQETKTIIQEVPEESCSLNPQKVCKLVTVLIPRLKPRQNCIDVPKEICTRMRKNPRKVKRPVIKKWCYKPKEEETTTTTPRTIDTTTTTTTIKPFLLYETPFEDSSKNARYQGRLPNIG